MIRYLGFGFIVVWGFGFRGYGLGFWVFGVIVTLVQVLGKYRIIRYLDFL